MFNGGGESAKEEMMNTPNANPEKCGKRTWDAPKGFILRGSVTQMPVQTPGIKPYAPVEDWLGDAAHPSDWVPHGPS